MTLSRPAASEPEREPFVLNESVIFLDSKSNESAEYQQSTDDRLITPLAFARRESLDMFLRGQAARHYAVDSSSFKSVFDYDALIEGDQFKQIYEAHGSSDLTDKAIQSARNRAGNLEWFLEAKQRIILTDEYVPARVLQKQLLADPNLRKTGNKAPSSKEYRGITEKNLLQKALSNYAIALSNGTAPVVVNDKVRADFLEHIERLRIGADQISKSLSRLLGFRAVSSIIQYIDQEDRIITHHDSEWVSQHLPALNPLPDALNSDAVSVNEYIKQNDERLALEMKFYYTLHATGGIPDRLYKPFAEARGFADEQMRDRAVVSTIKSFTNQPIHFTPANIQLYKERYPDMFEREADATADNDESAGINRAAFQAQQARAHEDRRLARLARKKQRLEQGSEHTTTDNEYLEFIQLLLEEQRELLSPYRAQTAKQLRISGVVGPDSLDYHLRRSKLRNPEGYEAIIKLYDGLVSLVSTSIDPYNDLRKSLVSLEEIDTEYKAIYDPTKQLLDDSRPEKGIFQDISWLHEHWTAFKSLANASKNRLFVTVEQQRAVGELLANITVAPPSAAQETSAPIEAEAPAEEIEALKHTNELIEQLDWVILPDESITPEELVRVARDSVATLAASERSIDRERMIRLLALREKYGGTLYRSSERTLGDSNNLYFVLAFERNEDEKTYAIAENMVYGNATYVIREDVMPLAPGETVLTAVKLSRKDVRELGAKRIIHKNSSRISHTKKIESAIQQLSDLEA